MNEETTVTPAPVEAPVPPAPEVVQEPSTTPPPAPVLPVVVHLTTSIQCVFGIVDGEKNVIHKTPITIELEKLNAQSLTAVLARIREERQKFAESAAAAGVA